LRIEAGSLLPGKLQDLKRVACAALFLLMPMVPVPSAIAGGATDTLVVKTSKSDVTFTIETADTPEKQALGLMFRRSIGENAGMLFVYPNPQIIRMWMRNTYISLDMVFISSDGVIAGIARNTEPFSEDTIASSRPVTAVLEISGGRAAALGIVAGDRVIHPHFRP